MKKKSLAKKELESLKPKSKYFEKQENKKIMTLEEFKVYFRNLARKYGQEF